MALHKDSLKEESDKMSTSMMRSMQNLEGLWEAIYFNLPPLFKSVVKMSYITAKKTVSNEEKRGIGKDYAELSKELLECIAPSKHQSEEEEKKHYLRQ